MIFISLTVSVGSSIVPNKVPHEIATTLANIDRYCILTAKLAGMYWYLREEGEEKEAEGEGEVVDQLACGYCKHWGGLVQ